MTITSVLLEFSDGAISATVTEATQESDRLVWAARFTGKGWSARIIFQDHIAGGRYREWKLINTLHAGQSP